MRTAFACIWKEFCNFKVERELSSNAKIALIAAIDEWLGRTNQIAKSRLSHAGQGRIRKASMTMVRKGVPHDA